MYQDQNDTAVNIRRFRRCHEPKFPDLPHVAVRMVMQAYDVTPGEMHDRSRGPARVALARQVAMYLTHVVGEFDYAQVGRLFGRDRTTVKHACAVVEDRRDDPKFDLTLQLLEGIVEHICGLRTAPGAASH